MNYIFIFIVIPFMVFSFFNLIKSIKRYNSRKSRLEDFSSFTRTVVDWADEIKDINIKKEFINYYANLISEDFNSMAIQHMNGEDKIDDLRHNIFIKFGDHIPSLKKDFRDKRLDKILGN